jgi:hypothetical protein
MVSAAPRGQASPATGSAGAQVSLSASVAAPRVPAGPRGTPAGRVSEASPRRAPTEVSTPSRHGRRSQCHACLFVSLETLYIKRPPVK